jgi:hypothetical protein
MQSPHGSITDVFRFWPEAVENDVYSNVCCGESSGLVVLTSSLVVHGRVEMWRGGGRPNISVVRLFRLAVP